MFPSVIDKIQIEGDEFYALDNGRIVAPFEISLVDTDISDLDASEAAYNRLLQSLNPKVLARVFLLSKDSFEEQANHSRQQAIGGIGKVENRLVLLFESDSGRASDLFRALRYAKEPSRALADRALDLKASFDLSVLRSAGIRYRSLSEEEFEDLLVDPTSEGVQKLSCSIDLGHSVRGIVRLVKQGSNPISPLALAFLKDSIPLPYKLSVSTRRLTAEASEGLLRRRTNEAGSGSDKIAASKYLDTQDALEEVALHGASLFRFEFLVELGRLDEATFRRDANITAQKLRPLGDVAIETFGAYPSFLAAQVGFDQHVSLIENDKVLPSFIPAWSAGEDDSFRAKPPMRSLALQRRDQSVAYLDLFNPRYDNFSACIFGRSGRGKSVLTNLLTRALFFDENVQIIKVDVGGSHSKETRMLGGSEFQLRLNEPSGINPFSVFRTEAHSEEICNVVATFLNVLLLDEGEHVLSKGLRGEIEKAVGRYSIARPINPSVDDFLASSPDLPRRELLERWAGSGAYRNALKPRANDDSPASSAQRLRYYNFSQIFQANDPDFGQGGLAAVMAQFNLDLMRLKGKKLVFIADETPFFVERCFSFFKFSTANVRKFGGSFVTIAQKSSDVVIGGDPGILENSSMKFLFSVDGEREAFQRRLKLEDRTIEQIESLQAEKGRFSEVAFVDSFGSRVLRVELTPEEYWSVTSSQADNEKLNSLLSAVPGLTLEEAIKCLAR